MAEILEKIESLMAEQKGQPPIDKWHPELSGDIDIVIDGDGRWFHEGGEIKRLPLVKLFASILRREEDGEYYLVTPVEKWRLRIEDCALMIHESELDDEVPAEQRKIAVRTNTERWYILGQKHPLSMTERPDGSMAPEVALDHGLSARVHRNVFYRWAELAEEGEREGEWLLRGLGGPFVFSA